MPQKISLALTDRDSATAAFIRPIAKWVGIALVLSAIANGIFRADRVWGPVLLAIELGFGLGLLAIVFATRTSGIPARAGAPVAGAILLGALGITSLIVWIAKDPAGPAYIALLAAFVGLLFLSWPWTLAGLAATLAIGALAAWSLPAVMDGVAVTFMLASGAFAGAAVHAVRLRQFRSSAAALKGEIEARAQLAAVIEHSPMGIVLIDLAQHSIVSANHAAEGLLGSEKGGLVGRDPEEFVHPEEIDAHRRRAARLLRGEPGIEDIDRRLVASDGSTRRARVRSVAMPRSGANEDRLLGIVIVEDLTERDRVDALLRQTDRDSVLGTLVAGVAHEINNPLQFIAGNVELATIDVKALNEALELSPGSREHARQIEEALVTAQRGIDAITQITRGLKQFVRASDGRRAPADLNALVNGVLTLARPRLAPDIEIVRELGARGRAVVNASEIAQVVLNLVLNASEALGKSGQIVLRTIDEPGHALVEVEDNGGGIPPAALPRIFMPYFTTKPTGTGLGLSISRRIVEEHGGTLTVDTRPGRTLFRIDLPIAGYPELAT